MYYQGYNSYIQLQDPFYVILNYGSYK